MPDIAMTAAAIPANENHFITRIGWLRAAVLGANDGVLSTASVITGVAAAHPAGNQVLLAGVAALVAGAMSMAAGEYVSVSSQSDTEAADLARERIEHIEDPAGEAEELAEIYIARGLDRSLANQVAAQLMAKDALGAHARDELGITETSTANPVQAALASAVTFLVGGIWPVVAVLVAPPAVLLYAVVGVALVVLAGLGAAGAKTGGAPIARATVRVLFWGALAMAVTAAIGRLFGTVV